MEDIKRSYLKHRLKGIDEISSKELGFLKEEVKDEEDFVEKFLFEKGVKINA